MSTTLKELRRALGHELGELTLGTVVAATDTTLVDPSLAEARPEVDGFAGAWVLLASGGQAGTLRRVATYDPTTGTLTPGRSWSSPAAGDEYEIHDKASPADLARFIQEGLKRCWLLYEVEIAAVDGQRQYSLAALTWLKRPAQVYSVRWRQGAAGTYSYPAASWWRVAPAAAGMSLQLEVEPGTAWASSTLVLRAIAYYGDLETLAGDTDESECEPRWVVAAAAAEAYDWLAKNGPAQDAKRYEQKRAEAAATFKALCRQFGPRPGLRR